jgi:hypothetical protein
MFWHSTERVAWTEHDGPERPPRGGHPVLGLGVAGVLAAVFAGMVLTDDLCPEHRAWVQALGAVALVGCIAGAVALVRGWAAGPAFAIGTALCGLAIGAIDIVHNPTRGWIITAAFGAVLLGAVWMGLRQISVRQWQLEQSRHLADAPDAPLASDAWAPTGEDHAEPLR